MDDSLGATLRPGDRGQDADPVTSRTAKLCRRPFQDGQEARRGGDRGCHRRHEWRSRGGVAKRRSSSIVVLWRRRRRPHDVFEKWPARGPVRLAEKLQEAVGPAPGQVSCSSRRKAGGAEPPAGCRSWAAARGQSSCTLSNRACPRAYMTVYRRRWAPLCHLVMGHFIS